MTVTAFDCCPRFNFNRPHTRIIHIVAESKRFKSLYEEDTADAQLAQERSSRAAEVAESVHKTFLTAQAKLNETRAERISLEAEAERLRDFSIRDRADAKQMQEDVFEAEVKACKKEEERVWDVMEAHRQEEARVSKLAHEHRQKSEEMAAAAEATKQGADLLAGKAARREKTRREEEARVNRLTNTRDEAKAALKRVQNERRSGEAKAKGMQAARTDAETKSAQAAREYEQRRAARAPANELLAQELAELRLALLAAEGGRLSEMRQHEENARSVQAQRRGAEAEAAATEIVALQHRELEALRHADHAEAYGRHDDAAHYLQQAAELRQSQAAESQIVYADKIAQLERAKRVEDDQLASMAQAEARRAGVAKRLIGIFATNVQDWRRRDEQLAADEKLKSLEVERLANSVAEAEANVQEDEAKDDKSNLKHLKEMYTAAQAALKRVQNERRSGEAKAKGMQAARTDAETKSAQAAREYEQRRAARAPANELLAQELAELRLALLAAEGGRLSEMRQHEENARSVQAQRRGAEAEAAATEIVALQHRELEALRHADHAEAYGRHDDAAHYLQQAAELRQNAQGLAKKIELSDPGPSLFC